MTTIARLEGGKVVFLWPAGGDPVAIDPQELRDVFLNSPEDSETSDE